MSVLDINVFSFEEGLTSSDILAFFSPIKSGQLAYTMCLSCATAFPV